MADFAAFALKVTSISGDQGRMEKILDQLTEKQAAFTMEGDPIIELLDEWLKRESNIGRSISTGDLCTELAKVSGERGIDFFFDGKPKEFGTRLQNLKSTLRHYFDMREERGHANKKMVSFAPVAEPVPIAEEPAVTSG
jgi:hypothetical protein